MLTVSLAATTAHCFRAGAGYGRGSGCVAGTPEASAFVVSGGGKTRASFFSVTRGACVCVSCDGRWYSTDSGCVAGVACTLTVLPF